jgi:glucosyl-dolichyl phosphate glucuronosyltransferase
VTVPPPTTVVIACHRTENLPAVRTAVESVSAQTVPAAACVVAVDHNADLAAAVEELPGVTVVQNLSEHRGASATRNAGAAEVATEVVAFLDDDETATATWLENLLPPLADPRVVGTGGRYVPRWEDHRPAWFPDELAWTVGGHHSGQPDHEARVRNVWSGNMAVRTALFRAVGGFRSGFGKTGSTSRPEDTDLCIRVARTVEDGHWVYVPTAEILHAVPADRSTFGFYVRRCYAEGRGKIELRDVLDDPRALDTERDYLRRTIPLGVAGHLADAGRALTAAGRRAEAARSLARAGAVVVGVGAAGIGGAAGVAARRRA